MLRLKMTATALLSLQRQLKDRKGRLGQRVRPDLLGLLVTRGQLDHRVTLDRRDQQARKAMSVLRDRKVPRVQLALLVRKASKATQVLPAHKAIRDRPVRQVRVDRKERKVRPALQVQQVRRAKPV